MSGAGLVIACGDDPPHTEDDNGSGATGGMGQGGNGGQGGAGGAPPETCDDLVAGGQLLSNAGWADAQSVTFGQKTNPASGWDARLYFDVSTLNPDYLAVPNELFYIRTEKPDQLTTNPADWSININGLVGAPVSVHINDLLANAVDQGVHLLECSGNGGGGSYYGLMSAAQWGGVPIADVLAMANVNAGATRVMVTGNDDHSVPSANGHSTPGAAWVFTFDQLDAAGAFLATEMNGEPLPPHHGEPVRLFIPGWYGCCNIKWVTDITLVDDNEPATSQMTEFASRTHQPAAFPMAAQYLPATLDQTATPVRIEKWLLNGAIVYRIVGIMWGGYELANEKLLISFDDGVTYQPVSVCPTQKTNQTWTMWQHLWVPGAAGTYRVAMAIDDPNIVTKRLDSGWYDRDVIIDEV